jgi:thiamine biosynthesis lipoprotein
MPERWRFEAIGTRWEIETVEPLAAPLRDEVGELIAGFDATWSRFRADSVVMRLAAAGGNAPLPGGAVNPLVGEPLARRGYDASSSFVDGGPTPAPADWESRLAWDEAGLRLDRGATIDVGALGKGRLVDLVLALVSPHVDGTVVVDASGDLAVRGGPVRIGLEHPYDATRAIGVFEVTDGALCASATNRRAWGDGLHHVLDARTGVPVRRIAATWALAPEAMHADAAATALFFDGGPELAAEWGVEWVRMTTDGRVEWSPGGRAELFV